MPAVDKTYANTVTLLNKKEAKIENFKVSSANTTTQHGFVCANSVRESVIDKLMERLVERDKEKVEAVIEVGNEIEKLGQVPLNTNE